jgi:hypothetical protein
MHAIKEDMVQALIDYDGSVLSFMGGNPSGSPLTVIINCIVNILRFISAYMVATKGYDFFQHVEIVTYGDDVVATVSDAKKTSFNFKRLSEIFATWNIKFTDAAKSSEVSEFSSKEVIQFLKRRFRFDVEIGKHMAPLDQESIFKSLYIWQRSKSISEYDQMVQIIKTAHREFFQHGRLVFEEQDTFLQQLLCRFSNEILPTYDYYMEEYIQQCSQRKEP